MFKLNNETDALEDLIALIGDDVDCDSDMVNHLVWDAMLVNASDLSKPVIEGYVQSVSFTTAGGMSF